MNRSLIFALLCLIPACHDDKPAAGPGERAGSSIDRAAKKTGDALKTAGEKTEEALTNATRATGKALGKVGNELEGSKSKSDPKPASSSAATPTSGGGGSSPGSP